MTHDDGSLKSFLRGALCLKKCIYLSLHCISLHIAPPCILTCFQGRCIRVLGWGENGRHVESIWDVVNYLCMGWNGYVAGKPKKRRGGGRGGLELVWHIGQKAQSS